jgi:hypothetical protein
MTSTTTAAVTAVKVVVKLALKRPRGGFCFVSGVSWGDGRKVKSITTTMDRSKAFHFSRATATDVMLQFRHLHATLESPDGQLLEEANNELRAGVMAKRAEDAEAARQFMVEMKPILDILQDGLRKAVR